ncbi:hypothetical protein HOY82DRAFT_486221 [Tuber indicum]|nr:hypothetical protein HOY82DRAFT_486221 [Tuber indicum]
MMDISPLLISIISQFPPRVSKSNPAYIHEKKDPFQIPSRTITYTSSYRRAVANQTFIINRLGATTLPSYHHASAENAQPGACSLGVWSE